jgi:biopolymer transport protein ExbB
LLTGVPVFLSFSIHRISGNHHDHRFLHSSPHSLDHSRAPPVNIHTSNTPLPHELSPWGMFLAADPVVQAVMIGLLLAVLMTWVVWLAKTWQLRAARREAKAALAILWRSASLAEAGELSAADDKAGKDGDSHVNTLLQLLRGTALHEWRQSEGLSREGIKERAAISLGRVEATLGRRAGRGVGILATIGATAPFIGLLGTVWGIMHAFIGISKSQTTNLAVVAPGIAEALLATAMGLFAAIPAVVIYNAFSRCIAGYRALIADAGAEVLNLLGRDLERRP